MDASQALKSVLSGLGYSVYQDKVTLDPEVTPAQYLIYRKISEKSYMTHQGKADLNRPRFQITHVADSPSNRATMVSAVKSALIGNRTNFNAAIASEIHIEDKESDKVYSAIKDYFIWFTE